MKKAFSRPLSSPEADAGGGAAAPAPKKVNKKDLLPDSDVQLAELAVYAAKQWLSESWLTIRYSTQPAFADLATRYHTSVQTRMAIGDNNPDDEVRILQLDSLINESLYRVKDMLTTKYDQKTAPNYFGQMGIEKKYSRYIMNRERTKRSEALTKLINGLTTEGFVTKTQPDGSVTFPHGTGFWGPIATEYAALITRLTDHTGAISKAVGKKDTLRIEVEMVLRSIAKILDGNYPKQAEYKAQLRAWGFQRESY